MTAASAGNNAAAGVEPLVDDHDDQLVALGSEETLSKFAVDCKKAIQLTFLSCDNQQQQQKDSGDQSPNCCSEPLYTHILFDNDVIYGYKNLQITFNISKHSLACWLDVKFDAEIELETLKVSNLMQHISQCLETEFIGSEKEFQQKLCSDAESFKPIGRLINSFTVDQKHYQIYFINQPNGEEKQYLLNYQRLNHFFIEYSRNIDIDDPDWEFFLVYECAPSTNAVYSVGFLSAYNFFSYPDRVRKRISQMLILPQYQKKGLGTRLLETFYHNTRPDCTLKDITVEEPNEHFTMMRDTLDLKQLLKDENLPQKDLALFRKYIQANYKLSWSQTLKMYNLISINQCLEGSKELQEAQAEVFQAQYKSLIKMVINHGKLKEKHPDVFNGTFQDYQDIYAAYEMEMHRLRQFLAKIICSK